MPRPPNAATLESMRSILFATDGSPSAVDAFEVAVELAEQTGASLHVVGVDETHGPIARALRSGARHQAHAASLHAVGEARRRNVPAGAIESSGDVVLGVLGAAESANADVIVVGSRGHGAVAAGVLGSVSNALLSRSTRPVLVVAAGASDPHEVRRAVATPIDSLVVAVDGSETAAAALEFAVALATDVGAHLHVVAVHEPPPPGRGSRIPIHETELFDGTVRVAELAAETARARGVDATPHAERGDAAKRVAAVADSVDADLLVVGSRALGGIQAPILGSVSRRLATHAGRPVAVVVPPGWRDVRGV